MRVWCAVCALLIIAAVPQAAEVRDYAYFVDRLVNLDALPQLEPGTRCRQFSSWDRASLDPKRWDANGDAGKYEKYDPAVYGPQPLKPGEALMAQMDGPGCIFRIWSANPQGTIRFYLDGATEPTYEFDFNKLFRGEYEDFQPPFVYRRSTERSASDCYLPIPYAKSCRVTADKAWGQYYHIGYMTYPPGTPVETFHWPLDAKAKAACAKVADLWSHCGADPRPLSPEDRSLQCTLTLEPGVPQSLAQLTGPAVLQTLRAKLEGSERYVWRKVLLRAWFDDEQRPCIECPLGEFFGTGWQPNEYQSFPLGVLKGEGYSYWAMPFRKAAKLEVLNRGVAPVKLSATLRWRPQELGANVALFHARWRREAPCNTFDYPFLQATGEGRLVGVALYIDHPVPGWWGEGDEKVWVDGESFPSIFGTGSEDFFGDAWGIRLLTQPMFACSYDNGPRTCCYRWLVSDHIPYEKSLRITIENYPPPDDYTSVAYWYQKPGGGDFFRPGDVDDYRPWGRSLRDTWEAEEIWEGRLGGRVRLLADDVLPFEYSHGLAVDFGPGRAGDLTPAGTLKLTGPGLVWPSLVPALPEPGASLATCQVLLDGVPLKPMGPPEADGTVKFEGVELAAGEHSVVLRWLTDGRLAVDALRLEPVSHVRDAVEAEGLLNTAQAAGGKVSVESARYPWSGGRQLVFVADGPGAKLTLQPFAAAAEASVTAVLSTGPDYGNVQFRVGDQVIGPVVSCYATQAGVKRVGLGTVALADTGGRVVLEVVGKDEKSTGFRAGIDYFLMGKVLYPGATEAETAPLLAWAGGEIGPQSGGPPGLSNGTHLWLRDTTGRGYMELEFSVPRDGTYEASVWFSQSTDYAQVQVLVDGQKLGPVQELYSADFWTPSGEIKLGTVNLKAGRHVLRVQVVGKNPASRGYYVGFDAFRFRAR